MIISRFIHVAGNGIISFILWLSNVFVYVYHISFTHSSGNEQLTCFHILAIVNSAAVIIWVHVYSVIRLFTGYMARIIITVHMVALLFCFFKEPPYSSPQSVHKSTLPTVEEGSLFSTPSPAFIICSFFFFFLWWPFWLVWSEILL